MPISNKKFSPQNILSKLVCMSILVLLMVTPAGAFVLNGYTWPGNTARFFVRYDSGSFDNAFIEAMTKWHGQSPFNFTWSTSSYVEPCNSQSSPDRINGYKLHSTYCGSSWGSTTLGITKFWHNSLGALIDADIVFNANKSWGVHNSNTSSPFDFRRVAVHELGHVIGLKHVGSGISSIMKPTYDPAIKVPQPDDINGLNAMYKPIPGENPVAMDSIIQLLIQ